MIEIKPITLKNIIDGKDDKVLTIKKIRDQLGLSLWCAKTIFDRVHETIKEDNERYATTRNEIFNKVNKTN